MTEAMTEVSSRDKPSDMYVVSGIAFPAEGSWQKCKACNSQWIRSVCEVCGRPISLPPPSSAANLMLVQRLMSLSMQSDLMLTSRVLLPLSCSRCVLMGVGSSCDSVVTV